MPHRMAEVVLAISEAGDLCDQPLRHDLANKGNSPSAVGAFATPDIKAKVYLVKIRVERESQSPQDLSAKELETDETDERAPVEEVQLSAARNAVPQQVRIDLIIQHDEITPLGGKKDAPQPWRFFRFHIFHIRISLFLSSVPGNTHSEAMRLHYERAGADWREEWTD